MWTGLTEFDPTLLVVGAVLAWVATLIGQAIWWNLHRPILIASANAGLDALARHWESSLAAEA